jgi:CheY-like chemotaxis protein
MNHGIASPKIGLSPIEKAIPGARILVVDDDEIFRNLYAAIFILEGYRVEMAADGGDAFDQLMARRFDLLVTDRNLPVLNGEGLVIALREAGIRIPVVMVSGSLGYSPLPEQVAREVSAALPKPVRAAEVLAAIFNALHPVQRHLCPAA